MSEIYGRVQLLFRLDNPEERAAFELIQSAPRRKSCFVKDCVLACRDGEHMAEKIAEKTAEILAAKQMLSSPSAPRKRGRPAKTSPDKKPSPKETEDKTVSPTENTPCTAKKESGQDFVPPKTAKGIPVPKQRTERAAVQRQEYRPEESEQNADEITLDEDILRSMENFINDF